MLLTGVSGASGGSPTPAPLSGAVPMVLVKDSSPRTARPARLNMMGYQREPKVKASMLPRFFGNAGRACWDIRTISLRWVRISCGLM